MIIISVKGALSSETGTVLISLPSTLSVIKTCTRVYVYAMNLDTPIPHRIVNIFAEI